LLSPAARHVAELAAIAGESYDASLAGRALARPPAELGEVLRELEARQILYGRQFVHDIVAAAVRRAIPAAVAELLHRFVAGQLEAAGGEPAVIAAHWRDCAEWRRAGDSFRAAAVKARRAVRPAELAQLLDAAADCYAQCAARGEHFAVLRERLLLTAAPDYTRTCAAQLQRLVASAANEEERLQAMVATVSMHADHARSDTIAMGEDGLRRAQALGLERLAFEFAHPLAWQYAGKGQSARALEVVDARRSWVLSQDDPFLQARFHTARAGTNALSERIADAIADGERAIEALRIADDPIEMLSALANVGLLRSWRGEFGAAREVLVEAKSLRDRLHGRGSSLLIDLHLGSALRDLGEYAQALALLEPALAEYRAQLGGDDDLRTDMVMCENHLGQLWISLGQPDRAEACLASDVDSTELRFRARRASLLLRAARARGVHDPARAARLRELTDELPPAFNRMMAELELARGLEPEVAAAQLAALCASPAMHERPGLRLHALALHARVLHRLGRREQARECVAAMLALDAQVMAFDADPPEVWAIAHAVLADAGETAAAAGVAEKAGRWLRAAIAGGVPSESRDAFARRQADACRAMGLESVIGLRR
jgi:tetratricopeptide (TPR) repeat protein